MRVGLSFPTGFDPEEVVEESVRANGDVAPETTSIDPRRGNVNDIYREFEAVFPKPALAGDTSTGGTIRITGRFRRGLSFSATLPIVAPSRSTDH